MNLVLVGPVCPYRGGIAHYTTMLHRTLRANGATAATWSFSRQYPSWLYPGRCDQDEAALHHREPGVRYEIDSLNPLTWWWAARKIARQAPDLVVFPWWTFFWAPCFTVMIALLKRSGRRVAFICHNLVDHETSRLKAAISCFVLRRGDAYLSHSSADAALLQQRFPGRPVVHHCHPVDRDFPSVSGNKPKRGRLELLFFGFIRPYKGLDLLLDALERLGDKGVYLTVAGEPWRECGALRQRMAAMPNVEARLEYVSDAEAAEYFARADFLVLPYRAASGSGVAALALQYETPIIAARVGGLPDVVLDGKTGILVRPGDAGDLAAAIAAASRERAALLAEGVRRFKRGHDWASLAAALGALT